MSPQTSYGYNVLCPFCWRQLLPADGLLHLALAPRLAYHLFDEHQYEAAILRLHLNRPPSAFVELEVTTP